MQLSIIIPTLNEEARLSQQLSRLITQFPDAELLVVDGGSSDATLKIAREFTAVKLLQSAKGRAKQMNAGAASASGDILLFLHADVTLPADAWQAIQQRLQSPAIVAGAFRIKTVAEGRRHWAAPWLFLADFRSRYSGLPYGDQAIFVRRHVFAELGGYANLALFEDLDFSRRLRRRGKIAICNQVVYVSGRRFLARPIYYTFLVNVMPLLFLAGAPTNWLVKLYGNPR